MFSSRKVISLNIGMLVILSELFGVSFALARRESVQPSEKPVTTVSVRSAQVSVATAATLRSIGIGY
jgi:hypothetical protein